MTGPAGPGLERGVFTLSLDFELIWGTLDLFGPDRFRRACEVERSVVFDRLLALLEELEISATWCVLGHLFLDRCGGVVAGGIEELDLRAHRFGQVDGEDLARLDDARLERVVEQAQAMPRGDQLEGQ